MQAYSDPQRECDLYALPDVEVFFVGETMKSQDTRAARAAHIEPYWADFDNGWYWWSCFPGCLPDSEPCGPFVTREEAMKDAQSGE